MFEGWPITIETSFDLSLVILITGALAYYFGKLINEVPPTRETDYTNYVSGILFLSFFVLFPPLLIYSFISGVIPKVDLPGVAIIILFQMLLLGIFTNRFQLFLINRASLTDYLKEQVSVQVNAIMDRFKQVEKYRIPINAVFGCYYDFKIPTWVLFLVVLSQYFIFIIVFQSTQNIAILFFSGVLLFASLSTAAVLYSWNSTKKYYPITIFLDDKTPLSGILTKIDDEFVNIIAKDKVYHVPISKIRFIEKQRHIGNFPSSNKEKIPESEIRQSLNNVQVKAKKE